MNSNNSVNVSRNGCTFPSRHFNLNDMHYANLLAVVEAASGLAAVEKYVESQTWQVFKKKKKPEHDHDHNNDDGLEPDVDYDVRRPLDQKEREVKITEMDVISTFRTSGRNLGIYRNLQMTMYKVACPDGSDKLIWVYKLGNHWIICN